MGSNLLNDLVVVKRSGQRVPFNGTKIAIAIKKAFDSVYSEHHENSINKVYNGVLKYISENYFDRKTISVETIQDIIEDVLKEEKHNDVYDSFNAYRLKRKASRETFEGKQQHKFIKATEKLIFTVQDEDSNPLELMFKLGKTISSEFAKSYLIDSKYVRSHDEGSIYIHDLDYYALGATFSTHLDLSFITADEYYFEKILKHLLCIKEEQCGEHSVTSIDYLFMPWLLYKFKDIFKRNLMNYLELEGFTNYINTKKIMEIIDKLETIYFKDNIFNKVIYSKRVKNIFDLAYENSIIELEESLKNKLKNLLSSLNDCDHKINYDSGYVISLGSNTSLMGLLINKVYLKILGLLPRLDHITTIYKLTSTDSELITEVSNLVLLNKNIAFDYINALFNKKLLIPGDYKNEVEYFSTGERILENVIDKNQTSLGRSIISKVSINLVRLAIESSSIKEFYNNLENMLEFARNELLQTFEYIASKYKKNYKYSFNDILLDSDKLDEDKKIRKVIRNGTLNIGYVGLTECIMILTNKKDLDLDDLKIAIDIVKFIRDKTDNFTDEYKLNFVPFETTNKTTLKYFEGIDKSIYGDVIKEGSYEPFYKIFDKLKISLEDRLKIESKIHKYSSGGYYELINIPKNLSIKKIMDLILKAKEYELGYFKIEIKKT